MEQYPTVPSLDTDRFGDFIVLEGAIMRERNYIQWIKRSIWYCTNKKNEEEIKPLDYSVILD